MEKFGIKWDIDWKSNKRLNWSNQQNYLKPINTQFSDLFDSLLYCINELSNTFCKHNDKLFNDKYIINLKNMLINFMVYL